MIKIRLKRNMLYLLALYLSYFIRKIISFIIDEMYQINAPYLFLFMMTLGEVIGGLTVYIYHLSNFRNKTQVKYFGIKLIYNRSKRAVTDSKLKKILLIIFAGSFDFFEFIIIVFYIPKIADVSPTISERLGCLTTIASSLICVYALGFKIGTHHKFSLIVMAICFFMTLILEFSLKPDEQPLDRFIFAHFLVIIFLISISFNDCIERYLANYNYLNPFLILMSEGIFEFVLAIFYSIGQDPFRGIINEYEESSGGNFALLIFLLIIYFVLCGVINSYKVYCNIIYTPMARSLTEYFLNPFINIYYLLQKNDFHQNYFYFIVCEIICILMDLSFYVYNEYLILFCFSLEHDTGDEIHQRALSFEMASVDMTSFENNFDEDDDEAKDEIDK